MPNWNSPFGNNTLAVLFHVDKNFERTSWTIFLSELVDPSRSLELLWNRPNFFLDNKIKSWKLHWLQFLLQEFWTFRIYHVMIIGSRIACTGNQPNDPRAHHGDVMSSKSSKFLQQKFATNATFRIWFYCPGKNFRRFYSASRFFISHRLIEELIKLKSTSYQTDKFLHPELSTNKDNTVPCMFTTN